MSGSASSAPGFAVSGLLAERDGLFQGAIDNRDQIAEVEGFGQIVEGAALGGLDRGGEGGLRAHHDDGEFRADAADARDEVEPVFIGHDDIGDDHIAFAILDPAPERRGRGGRAYLIAGAPQSLGQHGADRAVVVGD